MITDPDWASVTIGVFLCHTCAGVHRSLSTASRVKSVRLDNWDRDQVQVSERDKPKNKHEFNTANQLEISFGKNLSCLHTFALKWICNILYLLLLVYLNSADILDFRKEQSILPLPYILTGVTSITQAYPHMCMHRGLYRQKQIHTYTCMNTCLGHKKTHLVRVFALTHMQTMYASMHAYAQLHAHPYMHTLKCWKSSAQTHVHIHTDEYMHTLNLHECWKSFGPKVHLLRFTTFSSSQ